MLPGVLQSGGKVVEGVPARDAVEERHGGRRRRATRKLLGNKKIVEHVEAVCYYGLL